jgi:hypothetical protein
MRRESTSRSSCRRSSVSQANAATPTDPVIDVIDRPRDLSVGKKKRVCEVPAGLAELQPVNSTMRVVVARVLEPRR